MAALRQTAAPRRSEQDGPRPGSSRRLRRWLLRLVLVTLSLAALAVATVGALWPLTPSVGDAAQRVRADLAPHHATPLATLPNPDRVGRAVIATEDSRFYSNPGIDPFGVLRVAKGAVTGQNAGGATLEQQLAKRLYTPGGGGPFTQVEDVELAVKLDLHYSKATLLRLYLSDAYFGHGYYGLTQAAEGYFGREAGQLSWAQASLLAGLVQAPTAYDPLEHLALAKERQRHVLDRLAATGVLTRAEATAAWGAPLHLRGTR